MQKYIRFQQEQKKIQPGREILHKSIDKLIANAMVEAHDEHI